MNAVFADRSTAAPTMDSLELVDFINSQRQAGEADLRHDHFMVKVPKVLGEEHAPKFLGTQHYGKNNTRAIYVLPKREACLMAMSYSYELQAKVYDRMTMLEEQAKRSQFATTQTFAETLRVAADLSEQKAIAEAQRDEAIRTKAQIGSKREATAMAKTSAVVRQFKKLQAELGRNQQHATVLAVERATRRQFTKDAYVALRTATNSHGFAPVNVVDSRHGTVKAWPAIAWQEAFDIDLAKLFRTESEPA